MKFFKLSSMLGHRDIRKKARPRPLYAVEPLEVRLLLSVTSLIESGTEFFTGGAGTANVDLIAQSGPDKFYWNSLAEGGGFTFTYQIDNVSAGAFPDTTIDFVWSAGGSVLDQVPLATAFSFVIDSADDGHGRPKNAAGTHAISVRHAELNAGHRSPATLPFGVGRAGDLRMIIDPATLLLQNGRVAESSEGNNAATLKVVPLVINVVTHGFNPSTEAVLGLGNTSSFLEPYNGIADNLKLEPVADSILDGRVQSYVSNWDSTTGWLGLVPSSTSLTGGAFPYRLRALYLAAQAQLATEAQQPALAQSYRDVSAAYAQLVDAGNNAPLGAREAGLAAFKIFDDLTSAGNSTGFVSPLDPDFAGYARSGQLQQIQLIGHSRGAAVNAAVSQLFASAGFSNVQEFIALDGFSGDFSALPGEPPLFDGQGLLLSAGVDVTAATVGSGGELVNYRAADGLQNSSLILDNLGLLLGTFVDAGVTRMRALLDLRAPDRAAFDRNVVIPGSTHTTISSIYGSLQNPYIHDNLVGRNASAGLATGGTSEEARAATSGTASAAFRGFIDGSFESAVQLQTRLLALDRTSTGVADLDAAIRDLPATAEAGVLATWNATGNVRFVVAGGRGALQLVDGQDTAIRQEVILPDGARTVDFDLSILSGGAGDRLEVLFNGRLLGSLDLANPAPSTRVSLPLGTPASGERTGTFIFRISGPATSASLQLTGFSIPAQSEPLPGPSPLAVVSAGDPLSQTFVFFSGGDQQVYNLRLDAAQNVVAPATLVQAGAAGRSLAAVTLPDGSPLLFLIGADNQVYRARLNASGGLASSFALTQAGAVQSLAATTDAAGNPLVLVLGADSQVYFQRFDSSGNQSAGYALTSGGAVQSLSASGPVLFARGLDDQLYQNRFNGTAWEGYHLPAAGAVLSYTYSAASGLLLAIGLDSQLYAQKIDATGSSGGWFLTAAGGIAAVAQDLYSGKAEAFVIGLDDQVYVQTFDAAGNSLGYAATSPGGVKSIFATNLPGSPGIVAVGLDNRIYKLRFDNLTGAAVGGFSATGSGTVT